MILVDGYSDVTDDLWMGQAQSDLVFCVALKSFDACSSCVVTRESVTHINLCKTLQQLHTQHYLSLNIHKTTGNCISELVYQRIPLYLHASLFSLSFSSFSLLISTF